MQLVGKKFYCQDLLGIEPLQTARVMSVNKYGVPIRLQLSEGTSGLRVQTTDVGRFLLLGEVMDGN